MGFLKGITNFVLMLILGLLLMFWIGFSLLNHSVLSYEANEEMLQTTPLTEEITDALLDRYHMHLDELRFDKDVLLQFVNESGLGVMGYVFNEYDTMPDVDVTFLKDYVRDQIEKEAATQMDGNIDFANLLEVLRTIPEGESVTSGIKAYTRDKGFEIKQSEIDAVAEVYIENKDLDDEALLGKIVAEVAYEKLNVNEMSTTLSLQNLSDQLMERNPFTFLREIFEVIHKDFAVYIPISMFLLVLMIITVEFRVGTSAVWMMLAMSVAALPLQFLHLANFVIEKDYLDILTGLESYKNFMLPVLIKRLNLYTIMIVILIITLFILSKVIRKKIDTKIKNVEEKKHSRFILIRLGVFVVLAVLLFLNVQSAQNYNMDMIHEVQSLNPDEFAPQSVDLILREDLNIDFDF
ncbi:MAG: hypothetical protein JXR88_06205 [Clostridia bacterium]|nr:hypothetical protein [Clostridia bacterium]